MERHPETVEGECPGWIAARPERILPGTGDRLRTLHGDGVRSSHQVQCEPHRSVDTPTNTDQMRQVLRGWH
eukprot:11182611-Lingulodinium_polyedra.AAC.1